MATIGFIGLGNMGLPMAHNLHNAGFAVRAFDVAPESKQAASKLGIRVIDDVQELSDNTDFIVSMLPNGQIVKDLFIGSAQAPGLLHSMRDDCLLIDCSTIASADAKALSDYANTLGKQVIDAPVSGGVGGAQAASLTFIVGGEQEQFERAQDVLKAMGKNIFHAGGAGAGQIAKMCNNMLLAVHMAGTAEALQLGVDNGLDAKVLSDIMLQSSGRNWSLELYNPYPGVMDGVPSANDYQGGFMVGLMNKDLGLAIDAAQASSSYTPMGALAQSLFKRHGDKGAVDKDFSSIQQLFTKKSD